MRRNIRATSCGGVALALVSMILTLWLPASVRADVALDEAQDYENRIEFGYLSEDAKALLVLVRTLRALAAEGESQRLAHYLAAHSAYRWAQVLDATRKSGAEDAAKECIDQLSDLTRKDSKDVEAFTQKAACHGFLAGTGVIKAVTHGPEAGDTVAVALRLGPKNPRAHLVDALVDFWRPEKLGGDRARACAKFKHAAEFFESVPPGSTEFPTWGGADVYLWLGRCHLERGDIAAARSALEQALIIAPDFVAARRELTKLSAHGDQR
jgi:tetratricopeptide (TPR) repeat protein